MATLEKIGENELSDDVRGVYALLQKFAALYNAWFDPQVVTNSGRNKLAASDTNVTLELNIQAAVAAVVASPDFTLYDASDSAGAKIGITAGTVNPTYGLSFAAGAAALPAAFPAGGGDYVFAVSAGGSAYLQVTTNSPTNGSAPQITANTVASGASVPTPAPTVGYQALGSWQVAGGQVTITTGGVGIGSQNVLRAGGVWFWAA